MIEGFLAELATEIAENTGETEDNFFSNLEKSTDVEKPEAVKGAEAASEFWRNLEDSVFRGYHSLESVSIDESEPSPESLVNTNENSDVRSDLTVGELEQDLDGKSEDNTAENEKSGITEDDNAEEQRMEPPIVIKFKCPPNLDPNEFARQLKGQENGLNNQTIAQNIANRNRYAMEGRAKEGAEAQKLQRQKAEAARVEDNLKKGMSISDARAEANEWIKKQDALHNPDQIAGGDPEDVSDVGDSSVNKSIGRQWVDNVLQLEKAIQEYVEGKTEEELNNTKLNVKLIMEV